MKIDIDPELCTGCGLCVDVCPEVFELNEKDIAELRIEQVPVNLLQACLDAADSCPVEAISIGE